MNPCDNAIATIKLKVTTLQKEIFFENVISVFQGLYMSQSVPWLQDVSLRLFINFM